MALPALEERGYPRRQTLGSLAAGGTLGPVTNISEQRYEYQPRRDMMMRSAPAPAAAPMPETLISPGEIEVRSTVTVSFRIQ